MVRNSNPVAPVTLEFVPYNVKEITSIIKARLFSLDDDTPDSPTKPKSIYLDQNKGAMLPLMHPMAVELAARKIAGSGDLRKALDVCRHVQLN